ncbi:HAD family hydrolase [Jatrophihabitans sp. DSM 45814]
MPETLSSWNDTATRAVITDFVARVSAEDSADYVPEPERIAVFDNDGTLWPEKPMPVEVGFLLQRMAQLAERDPSLRQRQPFSAAYEKDYAWLGSAITEHYQGDDTKVHALIGGVLQAFAGWTVEKYQDAARDFLYTQQHPTLRRPYSEIGYRPMCELLSYLTEHGFTTYIASGGDRDFMRMVTAHMYGVPPERVIGSSTGLRYQQGSIVYQAEMDIFDDGPVKPVRIWARTGVRPLIAGGNANGDIEMLEFAAPPGRTALALVVSHDDPDRDVAYNAGSERLQLQASEQQWTTISIQHDWSTVFAPAH